MATQYLTQQGLEKIKKELDYLEIEKRKEIAETLKHAASFGDLRENFGYQQAKEDQAFLEKRIAELKELIKDSQIIQKQRNGKAQVGSMVTLVSGKEKQAFQIVGREEANPLEGRISLESPLGQAILGKSIGEKFSFETTQGKIQYKIIEIE